MTAGRTGAPGDLRANPILILSANPERVSWVVLRLRESGIANEVVSASNEDEIRAGTSGEEPALVLVDLLDAPAESVLHEVLSSGGMNRAPVIAWVPDDRTELPGSVRIDFQGVIRGEFELSKLSAALRRVRLPWVAVE